ncbi:Nuclear receptor corepressor 2-like [Mycena venus]|uniref:Nuclear receptor corepressor 2-like n=1 Tax=Mycena venus TaxID=2733690 RepID=A0A8H7D3U2_9AGAR|nr:Nuclear receptor corepressor 2-like [Mycena venus]
MFRDPWLLFLLEGLRLLGHCDDIRRTRIFRGLDPPRHIETILLPDRIRTDRIRMLPAAHQVLRAMMVLSLRNYTLGILFPGNRRIRLLGRTDELQHCPLLRLSSLATGFAAIQQGCLNPPMLGNTLTLTGPPPIKVRNLVQLKDKEIECGAFGIFLRKEPRAVALHLILLEMIAIARIKTSAATDVQIFTDRLLIPLVKPAAAFDQMIVTMAALVEGLPVQYQVHDPAGLPALGPDHVRARHRARDRFLGHLIPCVALGATVDRHRAPTDLVRRRTKSRSSSRSSIASTHVSDRPPSRGMSPATVPIAPGAVNGQKTLVFSPTSKVISSTPRSRPDSPSDPVGELTHGPSPTPSPIPGIHNARTSQTVTVNERLDIAADCDSQQPLLESPIPMPGLGNTLRDLDVDHSRQGDVHVGEQSDELPASPLSEQKAEAALFEVVDIVDVSKPKTTMPTWDVMPTVPEPPTFGLATPPPAPMSINGELSPQPGAAPSPEPAAALALKPVAVPPLEATASPPVAAPVLEPVAAPVVEPVVVPVVEPVVVPVVEPVAVPVVEPVPVPDSELELAAESTPQPAPSSPPQVIAVPTQPQAEYIFENIPRLADAKSINDALRTVVMTRLLRDNQTRDERINPILIENLSIAQPSAVEIYSSKTQDQLIEEVSVQRFNHGIDDPFIAAKSWLTARFERRRSELSAKTERLQLEYQALHQRWRRHCDILNQQAKPVEPVENVPASGRTTRRSAAMGDTVRSDLEMEQIIASLGYDEATDPNQLSTRNLAVIPDMISVTGETQYTYDDTNHLVENPSEYYAPCTGIHDWTDAEKELFLDKYAAFPKQFGVIAEFLPNKTASQCVDYYYLHKKKLIDFRRVVSQFAPNKRRRRRTGKQKGNGLLSDIRQHDAEVHGDFDDSPSYTGRPTRGRRIIAPEPRKPSARRNALQLEDATTATPTPEPEARPKRRRAAASSRSVLFQDDMDDDTDGEPKKKAKRGRKPKSAILDDFATPIPTPPITDIDAFPIPDPIQLWSNDDKALFLDLLAQHGENFKRIAVAMPNKASVTSIQVAEYFKANYAELDLAATAPLLWIQTPCGIVWILVLALGLRRPTSPPRASPGVEASSSDPSVAGRASGPRPASVPRAAPPMAFLTREASAVETTPGSNASASASADTSAADQHAAKPEASDKDAVPPTSSFEATKYPMSSLTYDPIWGGYYDPNSGTRPTFPPTESLPRGRRPDTPIFSQRASAVSRSDTAPCPTTTHDLLCRAVSLLYTSAVSVYLVPSL